MYGVTVVTAPTVEPISLAEAKQHLRFESTVEDALISALIVAARKHCETATRRAFVTQTLRLTRDTFPTWKECYQFRLPQPPLPEAARERLYRSLDLQTFLKPQAG